MDLLGKSKYATDLYCVQFTPLICGAEHVDNQTQIRIRTHKQHTEYKEKNIPTNTTIVATAMTTAKFIKTHAEADLLLFNVNSMLCIKLYWWCEESERKREREKKKEKESKIAAETAMNVRNKGSEEVLWHFVTARSMELCRIMTMSIPFYI